MLNRVLSLYGPEVEKKIFLLFSILLLGSLALAISIEFLPLMVLPAGIFLVALLFTHFKQIYFFFLFLIPFTIEIHFNNGLGTDLPAEPLMLVFTGIFLVRLLMDIKKFDLSYFKHPISILLIIHLCWIFMTSITAENSIISLKYFLAKLWYIVPFYFLPIYIFKSKQDFKRFFWLLFSALILMVLFVLANHATMGFTFADVNLAVKPFFRNKVNYASLIVIFIPFIIAAIFWYRKRSYVKTGLIFSLFLLLPAIYFAFTRAAMVSLILGAIAFFLIRLRIMKLSLLIASLAVVAGSTFLLINNRYMDYAPEFEKTVSHTQFNSLVEATAKGQDVSTMERVYRWLAGYNMVKERPFTGFGPGNFYTSYKAYTVGSFRTYVSNNPDKSGIHNYYLMIMVEQGVLGFLIFISLCIALLIMGENVYHQLVDPFYKALAMACNISLIIIMAILLINDMLEAVKIGSIFFLSAAFIMIIPKLDKKSI